MQLELWKMHHISSMTEQLKNLHKVPKNTPITQWKGNTFLSHRTVAETVM